jgi:hypothetical protein
MDERSYNASTTRCRDAVLPDVLIALLRAGIAAITWRNVVTTYAEPPTRRARRNRPSVAATAHA